MSREVVMPNVPPKASARIHENPGCDITNVGANGIPDETLQAQALRLSGADQALVADLLAHPPPPNQAMDDALEAHRLLISAAP